MVTILTRSSTPNDSFRTRDFLERKAARVDLDQFSSSENRMCLVWVISSSR
ncbi:hypothetical protein GCK32_022417 [Trichostrongylus colubriformis]|uniref:Uncharacterized protein n=1 Tax=Trichostrongylus colubriformis TaxID=6319 RepID=A0AAN8G343_TRICO